MLNKLFSKLKNYEEKYNLSLVLLLLFAFGIRIYKLNFQSLWSDEVFSLMVSDPVNSLSDIIGICHFDVHPPLFQLLLYFWFKLTSFSPFALRFLSVIFGVLGVYAIYKLGEELFDKYAGFAAGLITSVNYFHIRYSQDGRSYALLFFLATVSFLFFLKSLKSSAKKENIVIYTVISLLMIYTHYFGFVILLTQSAIGLFIILKSKEKKKLFFRFFSSALIVFAGFLPWLPVLLEKLQLKGVPIDKVGIDFIYNYFYWYFKSNALVILVFILIVFALAVKVNNEKRQKILIIFSWLFLSLAIPYLRSQYVPVLVPRYTIVTLPAIFLLCGIGISIFKNKKIYVILLITFVLLSLYAVFFNVSYFSKTQKEQWREGIEFIEKNNKNNSPVLGNWNLMFNSYSKALGLKTRFKPIFKPIFNSLLEKQIELGEKPSFWLMKGHFDDRIDWEVVKYLQKHFKKKEEIHLVYTHVEHYVGKGSFTTEDTENTEIGTSTEGAKKEEGSFTQRALRGDAKGAKVGGSAEGAKKGKNRFNYNSNKVATEIQHSTFNIQHSLVESPDVFLKKSTKEVQFKVVLSTNINLSKGVRVEKRIVDEGKKSLRNWSDRFGDYFLEPLASYDFSCVLFSEKIKQKNVYHYTLRGVIEPYTAFYYLEKGKYFIQYRFVDKKSGKILKNIFVPIYLKEKNTSFKFKWEKYLFSSEFKGNTCVISDNIYKVSFLDEGVFNSFDYDLEEFLKWTDSSPLLNYLKKKKYSYVVLKKDCKEKFKNIKPFLSFVTEIDGYKIYTIDFKKEKKKVFENIFNWNVNSDLPFVFYRNKKSLGKGFLFCLSDSIIVGASKPNLFFMLAFAKDKLWKKNIAYIPVSKGYYEIEFNGESLTENTFVTPMIMLYNKTGQRLKTIEALPLKFEKGKKFYKVKFKNSFSPFFTRSVKEKKDIAKGFRLPYFKSNLFFVNQNVDKIALSLYFYNKKGFFSLKEVKVNKLLEMKK